MPNTKGALKFFPAAGDVYIKRKKARANDEMVQPGEIYQ
jgi:hypothetical protein